MIITMKRAGRTIVVPGVTAIRYFHQQNTMPVWMFSTGTDIQQMTDTDMSKYTDIACIDGQNLYWLKRGVAPVTEIGFVTD